MITIIKQGKTPRDHDSIYQFKCRCGCEFTAQYPIDFIEYGFDPLSLTMMAPCPTCGIPHARGFIAKMRYYFNCPRLNDQ